MLDLPPYLDFCLPWLSCNKDVTGTGASKMKVMELSIIPAKRLRWLPKCGDEDGELVSKDGSACLSHKIREERKMEKTESRTRKLAEITIFASLYATLTWVLAPISYQMLQFRVSECLKAIVVKRRWLILAFVIGNALSNIFSPFAGPWEFIWMPFINLVGGLSAWFIGTRLGSKLDVVIGGLFFAIWVAFGVSFMLTMLFGLPLVLTFVYVLIPEIVTIVGFSQVMAKIHQLVRYK